MSRSRLVYVKWEDSNMTHGWEWVDDDDSGEVMVCESVGWLVLDGEHVKVLAPHISGNKSTGQHQCAGVMRIPTRTILTMTDIPSVHST